MFFHNFLSHVSSYFRNSGNSPKGYKFNEIEKSLNEMSDNQDKIEEILDFIVNSNFLEGDEENIFKTIELLLHAINIHEQNIQNEIKKANQYKRLNKIDKLNECIQTQKDFLQKNESILNVILFLENKQVQIQINKSIFNLHLDYLTNIDIDERYSKLSDDDEDSTIPNEIQVQQNYFKCIFDSILSSGFDPDEEENINNSIDNLLSNLNENEQRSQQLLKSNEFKRQKENNQFKNYLRINKILTFFSSNIIQLISMLQKKFTILQIVKSANQLSIDISVTDEFPNILTDESEQQEFYDKINNEILTAKFNSKSEKKYSTCIEQLRMVIDINAQRIQKEQRIISHYKSSKEKQLEQNHLSLNKIFTSSNEKVNDILGNILLQLEYGQQRKMSSKMIKKFSKKNIENEVEAQADEFNELQDQINEIGDMMNFNNNTNYDNDSDFD